MSTTIKVTYQNKEYQLEYTRRAVKHMEDNGFVVEEVGNKPVTMIPLLVYGAFMKHHQSIKRSLVDEIYENIVGKIGKDGEEGFIQTLLEMYAETIQTLTDDSVADEGNVATWKVTRG